MITAALLLLAATASTAVDRASERGDESAGGMIGFFVCIAMDPILCSYRFRLPVHTLPALLNYSAESPPLLHRPICPAQ